MALFGERYRLLVPDLRGHGQTDNPGGRAAMNHRQFGRDVAGFCRALGIEMYAHHHVEGANKSMLKSQIHDLKKQRDEALAAHDHKRLKDVRREIHHIKTRLHRAAV